MDNLYEDGGPNEKVPLQIQTSRKLRSALKAGVACDREYSSMKEWVEDKIQKDFGDFIKDE